MQLSFLSLVRHRHAWPLLPSSRPVTVITTPPASTGSRPSQTSCSTTAGPLRAEAQPVSCRLRAAKADWRWRENGGQHSAAGRNEAGGRREPSARWACPAHLVEPCTDRNSRREVPGSARVGRLRGQHRFALSSAALKETGARVSK